MRFVFGKQDVTCLAQAREHCSMLTDGLDGFLPPATASRWSSTPTGTVLRELAPMESILREGCIGQRPEVYDGLEPGRSKGCFAQAWSVGELLRVYETLEIIEQEAEHHAG